MQALFWATNQRKANVVQVLVRKGAKVDIKDQCGQTAIDLATNKGYGEVSIIWLFLTLTKFNHLFHNI
jgi:ankyrin repeat protein